LTALALSMAWIHVVGFWVMAAVPHFRETQCCTFREEVNKTPKLWDYIL
jgi:hypothetical protein